MVPRPERLYSEEWVAAFNEAVAGLEPERGVSFRMLQVVHGGPEGTVRVALSVEDGRVHLERQPPELQPPEQPGPCAPGPGTPAREVTLSVRYEDAVLVARGELDPAGLLAAGRVKVRGDVSVLVSGQSLLASVARRLEGLSERPLPG